ncbi:MAG TPA: TetR/AcrR family transcriptional regulator [Solirubrobacterales bacterium]
MRTRKPAEQRRSEIIEATLRLADQVGPDRLSTAAIASAVGLTQAAIFRHFPTKQDLWQAVAEQIGQTFQQRWLAAERTGESSQRKLRCLVAGQLELIQSTPAIPAILFSRELHVENDRLRLLFCRMMESFHEIVTSFIAAAQRAGELRPDLDPRDQAYLVIGLVQGLVLRWSLGGRGFDLVEEGTRLLEALLGAMTVPGDRPVSADSRGASTAVPGASGGGPTAAGRRG